jgi:hypothetical protein
MKMANLPLQLTIAKTKGRSMMKPIADRVMALLADPTDAETKRFPAAAIRLTRRNDRLCFSSRSTYHG